MPFQGTSLLPQCFAFFQPLDSLTFKNNIKTHGIGYFLALNPGIRKFQFRYSGMFIVEMRVVLFAETNPAVKPKPPALSFPR